MFKHEKKEENILWYEFLYEKWHLAPREKKVSFLMGREFERLKKKLGLFFNKKNLIQHKFCCKNINKQ